MIRILLFDWGSTLMVDFPDQVGPMFTWKKIEAVKNAEKCLSEISKYFPCYVATNAKESTKDDIYKALNAVNIGKYIKDIFCYREIGFEKPGSGFFNYIFNKLLLVPNEIAMIGDDLEKDFKGANQNGLCGILFDPNNHHQYFEPRINDLLELHDVIIRLNKKGV
jgi:FMN phosphatase YigB (HAD superfamily)